MTRSLDRSFSFSSLTIPDLLELPKSIQWKRQSYPHHTSSTASKSFISTIDIFQTTLIHPINLLAFKVFAFSILYHIVEEKTSKTIEGFNYSWYITLFELTCAWLLEAIERITITYNHLNSDLSKSTPINSEFQSLIPTNSPTHQPTSNITTNNKCINFYYSIISVFQCYTVLNCSYILLSLNLIFSRGLATVVLQVFDMDYPTYAICRNSKMIFVMILSVVWLKKSYHFIDFIMVILISVSVLCFRLSSHEVWFSTTNAMGVPLLLLSTFLSAMDNSWKEKVTVDEKRNISPNEILFNINLLAIGMLFLYLTVFSNEYFEATAFLWNDWHALSWMIVRGISYSLWIHFSVVLISKAGAVTNQYVSASRKLFSVLLSFIIFEKPFGFMHGIGFVCFAFACVLKVSIAHNKEIHVVVKSDELELIKKSSDQDDESEGANMEWDGKEASDIEMDERKHNGNHHRKHMVNHNVLV